jgi:hypothetical protein
MAVPSFCQAKLHGDSDHLRLGAVVQVTLDSPQPGGRVVDCQGAGPLQLADSFRESGDEQLVGIPEHERHHQPQGSAPVEAVGAQDGPQEEHPETVEDQDGAEGPRVPEGESRAGELHHDGPGKAGGRAEGGAPAG